MILQASRASRIKSQKRIPPPVLPRPAREAARASGGEMVSGRSDGVFTRTDSRRQKNE